MIIRMSSRHPGARQVGIIGASGYTGAELVRAAESRDLVPIVEVTTDEESVIAVASGAKYVGVNARDLDSLVMDAERAKRVLENLLGR